MLAQFALSFTPARRIAIGQDGGIAVVHKCRGCRAAQARSRPRYERDFTLTSFGHGYSSPLLIRMIAYLAMIGKRSSLNGW